MEHLFVSCELALKLKEKGFDEECLACFRDVGHIFSRVNNVYPIGFCRNSQSQGNINYMYHVATPLYQQVIDWFREKHKIIVDVRTIWINKAIGLSEISSYVPHCNHDINVEYDDYYKAFDIAIEEALTLI